jgi:sirohydrochlorin cobaltochelatase
MSLANLQSSTLAVLLARGQFPIGPQEDWNLLAEHLSCRLEHRVELCVGPRTSSVEQHFASIIESNSMRLHQRIVLLPIDTIPLAMESLTNVLAACREHGSRQEIYPADEIGLKEWSLLLQESLLKIQSRDDRTVPSPIRMSSICLVGSIGQNKTTDDELPLLCHHLRQQLPDLDVDYAYLSESFPIWDRVIDLMREDGLPMVFIPWKLREDEHLQVIKTTQQRLSMDLGFWKQGAAIHVSMRENQPIASLISLLPISSITHLLMEKYLNALSWRSVERYIGQDTDGQVYWHGGLWEMERRIDTLLPSEYRGKTDDVSPTSMGSASIRWDNEGRVAWDQIWTSFCDLAMAGGPPHRGKLLEAVSGECVSGDIEAYRKVASEIRRGIEMVTHLKTIESTQLGWVGIRCDDEAMAVWLLRAIIVENVMVRRESDTLFVPAGPHFSLHKEIKNVITSVAKTVHYWRAHLRLRHCENLVE